MSVRDDLGTRMKNFYEFIPKTKLMRHCPVVIRIDGKSFHTFTRKFEKPFDEVLIDTMHETMKYLCENIQGCVLGYTQSDEITLILIDYKKLNSDAWFDYEVQKMCSIAASMATMAFNKFFIEATHKHFEEELRTFDNKNPDGEILRLNEINNLENKYDKYVNKFYTAMFDARCFNIPKEEVTNLIYWRQLDASRNSIQMVGRANFSHKEFQNKSCNQIQDMLMEQKGINWNDFPIYQKRGSCCIKDKNYKPVVCGDDEIHELISKILRPYWTVDKEIPIFEGEDREYIDRLINVGE